MTTLPAAIVAPRSPTNLPRNSISLSCRCHVELSSLVPTPSCAASPPSTRVLQPVADARLQWARQRAGTSRTARRETHARSRAGRGGVRRAGRRQDRLRGLRRPATPTVVLRPDRPDRALAGRGRRRCPTWPGTSGWSRSTRAATAARTGRPTPRPTTDAEMVADTHRGAGRGRASSGRCWSASAPAPGTRCSWRRQHPDRVLGSSRSSAMAPVLAPPRRTGPSHVQRSTSALDTDEGWAKYNRHYWRRDWPGFAEFFFDELLTEPHSTKQRRGLRRLGAARPTPRR